MHVSVRAGESRDTRYSTNTGNRIHVVSYAVRSSANSNRRNTSAEMRAALQYRTGLCASALTSALDERERRGTLVTQADRLGDTAVNTVGTTTRHNRFNRCAYEAIAAVATGAVLLGDKGDGSPRARAEAVRRNAHYNAGHCPDIIDSVWV